MDCFTSTLQGYQPIFVGAGCLVLGYMYGRHCRSVIESNVDVPMASDAACCVQTECNYVSDHVAEDPERMAVIRHSRSCPSDSALVRIQILGHGMSIEFSFLLIFLTIVYAF